MPPPIVKVADAIVKAFGVISILTGLIVAISNRNKVLDFFTDTFKVSWIFYLLIVLVIVFAISLGFNFKQQLNNTGLVRSSALDIEQLGINQFNKRLRTFRILSGLLTSICFCLLLWSEFKTLQLGIYAGSFGADIRFNEQVHAKVRDNGRVAGFAYYANPSMPYLEDPEKQGRLFHRYYDQGILYSGQYDNSTNDSIINLEVRWIGSPFHCPIKAHFSGEFSKCTVDVNADAMLISNFILGFANMHVCNTSKALEYFDRVYNDIEGTKNAHIRARMKPLKDSLDRYIKRMNELIQVFPQPGQQDANIAASVTAGEQAQSVKSEQDSTLPQNTVSDSNNSSLSTQSTPDDIPAASDDIIVDNFSTMSADSAKMLIREIDTLGNLTLHQPGTNSKGMKFTMYPIHVYKIDGDYYVAYKLHVADAWYSFLNLRTMIEERHSISPLTPGQIENYLLRHSKTTFKFIRRARIQYYNGIKLPPIEGRYSGITITIWSNIPKTSLAHRIKLLNVENALEGTISLQFDGLVLLRYFPCHILINDKKVVFIEKGYQSSQYREYRSEIPYDFRRSEPRKFFVDSIRPYIERNYKKYYHIEFQKSPVFRIEKYTDTE